MSPRKRSKRGRGAVERSYDLTDLLRESQLPENLLPSNGDLIRLSRFVRSKHKKKVTIEELAHEVVHDIWSSRVALFLPSTVILSYNRCHNKVQRLLERAKVLSMKDGNISSIQSIISDSGDIFDLFKCRYNNYVYEL